jgi:hypothetical protein
LIALGFHDFVRVGRQVSWVRIVTLITIEIVYARLPKKFYLILLMLVLIQIEASYYIINIVCIVFILFLEIQEIMETLEDDSIDEEEREQLEAMLKRFQQTSGKDLVRDARIVGKLR